MWLDLSFSPTTSSFRHDVGIPSDVMDVYPSTILPLEPHLALISQKNCVCCWSQSRLSVRLHYRCSRRPTTGSCQTVNLWNGWMNQIARNLIHNMSTSACSRQHPSSSTTPVSRRCTRLSPVVPHPSNPPFAIRYSTRTFSFDCSSNIHKYKAHSSR